MGFGKFLNPVSKDNPLNLWGASHKDSWSGAGDLLLGKKDPGVQAGFVGLDPVQQKALNRYSALMDTDTDQMAKNNIALAENQARANAQDQARKAETMVAQRGLGGSSIGMNSILGAHQNLSNQVGAIRASEPQAMYDAKVNNLTAASNGIGTIMNNRIYNQGRESRGRVGGLAPLIGAGIGGYYGGAGGAQAGMGAGQAVTQIG